MTENNIPTPLCESCANCITMENIAPEGQVMRLCIFMPLGMPLLQLNEGQTIPNVKNCTAYEKEGKHKEPNVHHSDDRSRD